MRFDRFGSDFLDFFEFFRVQILRDLIRIFEDPCDLMPCCLSEDQAKVPSGS